jgi:hypothetical protein
VNVIEAAVTAWSKVAQGAVPTATPVAPDSGAVAVTTGTVAGAAEKTTSTQ